MTKYEVLLCLYYYLDKEYFSDKNKSDEYINYISSINPDIWSDAETADMAYYQDYLKICSSFFSGSECSVQDGLKYARRYLDAYNTYEHNQFSSNIDEVVTVFGKCTLSDWEKIYHWVKNR
ncbi:hypothetical protein D7V86_09490 [bacterium D16-51]|nr:hypothetical protein D7V96_20750 [bacterium D16-59]RKI60251.1 hypothetical protein D7V86_09490 [bacterium D16-51]